jgi:hypothetical protein
VLAGCSNSTMGSVSLALTALVSPATANQGQPNESVVANNIQNSFKAFEDDNHDGLADH